MSNPEFQIQPVGDQKLYMPTRVESNLPWAADAAEIIAQQEIMGTDGHGSLRNENLSEQRNAEKIEATIDRVIDPRKILKLRQTFDDAKEYIKPDKGRTKENKEQDLQEELIYGYLVKESGDYPPNKHDQSKKDERILSEKLTANIKKLMNLSLDELAKRADRREALEKSRAVKVAPKKTADPIVTPPIAKENYRLKTDEIDNRPGDNLPGVPNGTVLNEYGNAGPVQEHMEIVPAIITSERLEELQSELDNVRNEYIEIAAARRGTVLSRKYSRAKFEEIQNRYIVARNEFVAEQNSLFSEAGYTSEDIRVFGIESAATEALYTWESIFDRYGEMAEGSIRKKFFGNKSKNDAYYLSVLKDMSEKPEEFSIPGGEYTTDDIADLIEGSTIEAVRRNRRRTSAAAGLAAAALTGAIVGGLELSHLGSTTHHAEGGKGGILTLHPNHHPKSGHGLGGNIDPSKFASTKDEEPWQYFAKRYGDSRATPMIEHLAAVAEKAGWKVHSFSRGIDSMVSPNGTSYSGTPGIVAALEHFNH